jgi:Derlin-2/3
LRSHHHHHYHHQEHPKLSLIQTLRGGGRSVDDDEEFDDDDDDDLLLDFDDDDDDDELNSMMGGSTNEFDEVTMIDRMIQSYHKTPPFTKLYLSISFLITMYGYLCNRNEFPNVLLLHWKKVITQFQIWRIVTSFFHFGPFGLGYIMTVQFVWVYMSTLERIHHNKPYDFWIMILFGQLCMVLGYPIMKLSPKFLGHNLSTFLVYIWSRYHEGVEVNMFELFNTRAELLPWFFLGQTFLLEGEIPILDFLGIVFGHIYHHCKTVGILRAPTPIVEWYETSETAQRIRELYKPISSEFDVQL